MAWRSSTLEKFCASVVGVHGCGVNAATTLGRASSADAAAPTAARRRTRSVIAHFPFSLAPSNLARQPPSRLGYPLLMSPTVSWWLVSFLCLLQGAAELFPVSSLSHAVVEPLLFHPHSHPAAAVFLPFLVLLHLLT